MTIRLRTVRSQGLPGLVAQATSNQAAFVLNWAETMARELNLVTCIDPVKPAAPAEA